MAQGRYNMGYQPEEDLENPEPPKGGSGVPNKSEKRKNLFVKARLLESLTNLYAVNENMGIRISDDIHRYVKAKIKKILDEI